jgi:hypothetical protein
MILFTPLYTRHSRELWTRFVQKRIPRKPKRTHAVYSTRSRGRTKHAATPTKKESLTSNASSARSLCSANDASPSASSNPASSTRRSADAAPTATTGYSPPTKTRALRSACTAQPRHMHHCYSHTPTMRRRRQPRPMRYQPGQLERRKAKGQVDGSKKGKADTKLDKPKPRRRDSCTPNSVYMGHRVRRIWNEWENISARASPTMHPGPSAYSLLTQPTPTPFNQCVSLWRPSAAQRRRPRRGMRSQARAHSPPPPRGERW